MTKQSYTKRTYRQTPKDPVEKFYSRLHDTLRALQKMQRQLPPDTWAKFAAAYSRHWLYSIDHGEKASAPGNYYNEWAEVQASGAIGMATSDDLHAIRNYGVYESPRDRARQVLGFEEAAHA